jgi:hypothetical protein
MFCNGDNVATSDFGHGNTAIGFVGRIEVDMIRSNASSNGQFELLGFS